MNLHHPPALTGAVLCLAAGLLIGCQPIERPAARASVAAPAAMAEVRAPIESLRVVGSIEAVRSGPIQPMKRTLDALLVDLIDIEGDVPRWHAYDYSMICGEGTTLFVDGMPLEPGAPVPMASFDLDGSFDGACPLGVDGPRLFGPLRMTVYRDDEYGLVGVPRGQL